MFSEKLLYRPLEAASVGLDARTANCAPFARVKHSAVNCCPVAGPCHDAAKRVDFAHEMAFANAADRWVA